MFKKKCPKCKEKVSNKYNFCPYCRTDLNRNPKEDFGMLGKNDYFNEQDTLTNSLFGNISGNFLNNMIKGVMGMLEKEMQKEMPKSKQNPKRFANMRLMINGKEINLNNNTNQENAQEKKQKKHILNKDLPQKSFKVNKKTKKEEPETTIRRLADEVIYEINIPGVKSLKDVSITKLENSVEIKALAKDKFYIKIIPINLPITAYNFSKEKIILEFGTKN